MRAIVMALLGLGLMLEPAMAARSAPRAPSAKAQGVATAKPITRRVQAARTPAVRAVPTRGVELRAVAARSGAERMAKAAPHRAGPARVAKAPLRAGGRSVVLAKALPHAAKYRVVVGRAGLRQVRTAWLARGLVGRATAAPLVRSVGWSHGLPPAAGTQADHCPAGTMATLARGHDDVVRCMPI